MVQIALNDRTRKFLAKHNQVGSETTLVLALYVVVVCCTLTLLALPRAVAPVHLPALEFHSQDTARFLRSDEAAGTRRQPLSDEARTLISLYEHQGLAEAGVLKVENIREAGAQRRTETKQGVEMLLRKHGPNSLEALRAHALGRLQPALQGKGEAQERQAALGSFPLMLERYGLVQNGKPLAPYPVVRTLFKARWNFIHGLIAVDGFSPEEHRIYYGWLALHAPNASFERRMEAAILYKAAQGARANEAMGVLLYQANQYIRAFQAFSVAYHHSSNLRLRNHAFAAQQGMVAPTVARFN